MSDECDPETEFLMSNGKCSPACEPFTYQKGDICVVDTCSEGTQFLLENGRCKECETYSYTEPDGKSCGYDKCDL